MKKRKSKRLTVTVSGYYGHGSIGDEAVLRSILSGIDRAMPKGRVFVLTGDKPRRERFGSLTVIRLLRLDPVGILFALGASDILISGGGSLLQDSTSRRSLYYYCALIRLARLLRTKVCIFANGIGPLRETAACRKALLCAERISVRDPDSLRLAQSISGGGMNASLTADPVFAYPFGARGKVFLPCLSDLAGMPFFAVSLRKCANGKEINKKELFSAILTLKRRGLTPVFVSMQDSFDLELCRLGAAAVGGRVVAVKDADELFFLLEKAAFAVGMRLHFLLCAAIAGTPTIALSYDQKVESCMRYLSVGEVLSAFDFSERDLVFACEVARRGFRRSFCEERCNSMKRLAEEDIFGLFSMAEEIGEGQKSKQEKFFADT